jgi:hypothetical protein
MNHDLYCGDGASALRHVRERRSPLERSLVQRSRHLRIPYQYRVGCCLLAAAERAPRRYGLLWSARRAAGRLRREKLAWANGLAGVLEAGVAACRKDTERARAILRETITTFEQVGMSLYAAAARRRLGTLLGNDEGRRLVEQADAWMAQQSIRNPARIMALYAPGFPS